MFKKSVLSILLFVSFFMIFFGSYYLYLNRLDYKKEKAIEKATALDIPFNKTENDSIEKVENIVKENGAKISAFNEDFIGWIRFENDLINLPVVQCDNNEYYLRNNIYKEKSIYGCTFLDAFQSIHNQNITLYGHHIYNDQSVCFSPLMELYDSSNYIRNKNLSFVLKTGEILKYELISVTEYDGIDNPYFAKSSLTDVEWNAYIDYINNQKLYETDVIALPTDKILCFQTCVKHNDPRRFLVFARLVEN